MRQLKISNSITKRDAASFDKYLSDIAKLPMVTAEEEVQLAQKIRSGDQIALQQLVSANLRFVVSVAKQYQNNGILLQDLVNEGNLGLLKAAQRYDETRGFKFISYAVWWIRQSIIQAISEQSRTVRIPLNRQSALSKINKAQGSLEQQLGRSPVNSEIAEFLNVPEQYVIDTKTAGLYSMSTDAFMSSDSEETLLAVLKDKSAILPDEHLLIESLKFEINRLLSILMPRERDVVVLFFGLNNTPSSTLEEIALNMALSRERVRQIKESALRKLKKNFRNKLLLPFLA